ncbi:MAG: dCTP deaminase [Chloroflexi bacterium]|nr:dCTP deaminase [Chloroflexota bacterium]
MVLSDRDIKESIATQRIIIEPLDKSCIQPASVDVHLGNKFLVFRNSRRPYIDVRENMDDLTEEVEVEQGRPFILHPGEFVLGCTLESIALANDIVGRLEGKSSLGRLGLLIHSTAGFIDPGWRGCLTLELSNVANLPITLYCGMKIGQISFLSLTSPVETPYGSESIGSKYQGNAGPTPSRYYQDFAKDKG